MPIWKQSGSLLRVDEQGASFEAPACPRPLAKTWTLSEWLSDHGARSAVAEAIGLDETVVALAWAWEHTMSPAERALFPEPDSSSYAGRPHVSFSWSRGRGVPGAMWIVGRTLRVSLPGVPNGPDVPFDTLLASGLPAPWKSAMPEDWAIRVMESIRLLAPLPCFCGTGFERAHEHDALALGPRVQHPSAPIDFHVTAARCRVCGERWLLEESGDSHYEYHYRVERFAYPKES
jgi:hypothetical protein